MKWIIRHKEITESTNTDAWKLGMDGFPSGTVCVADAQTSGRGRMDRKWYSPAGKGLYISALIRPDIPSSSLGFLSFCAANAMLAAIQQAGAMSSAIKWPNDIVCNGKKVCGILSVCNATDEKPRFAVIGAGLNLKRGAYPEELSETAISLEETGVCVASDKILDSYLTNLASELDDLERDGFSGVRQRLTANCITIGREVFVSGTNSFRGTARDIGEDGGLIIDTDGKEISLLCGDVSVRGIHGYV